MSKASGCQQDPRSLECSWSNHQLLFLSSPQGKLPSTGGLRDRLARALLSTLFLLMLLLHHVPLGYPRPQKRGMGGVRGNEVDNKLLNCWESAFSGFINLPSSPPLSFFLFPLLFLLLVVSYLPKLRAPAPPNQPPSLPFPSNPPHHHDHRNSGVFFSITPNFVFLFTPSRT